MALPNKDNNSSHSKSEQSQILKKRSRVTKRELDSLNDNNSKKARQDYPKCLICEHRIDPIYWNEHYQYELTQLSEPTSNAYIDPNSKNKGKRGAAVAAKQQLEKSKKNKTTSIHQETLDKIQKNRLKRTSRLKQLDTFGSVHPDHETTNTTTTTDDSAVALQVMLDEQTSDVQTCFICNERLFGDLEAINLHIDSCLTHPQSTTTTISTAHSTDEEDDHEEIDGSDVEAETENELTHNNTEAWDEYEWAGQRRVRATAMMEGGYGGAGFATASKKEIEEDDEEDLDVEDDDAAQYGVSQYTERDIVVTTEDDHDEDASALREMVSGGSSSHSTSIRAASTDDKRLPQQGFEESVSVSGWDRHVTSHASYNNKSGGNLVIDSLKARIHQLESASRSVPRCLICLEPYKTPLTSIVCWHVHCDHCWLQTLGTKKLCPQCQKITTPADLRRIYL